MKEMKKTFFLIAIKNLALVSFIFYFHITLPDVVVFGVSMKMFDHLVIALMTFLALTNSDISSVKNKIDRDILATCERIQKLLRDSEIKHVSERVRDSLRTTAKETQDAFTRSDIH